MIRRPPRSTRTDTLFPYTTLFRSALGSTPSDDTMDLPRATVEEITEAPHGYVGDVAALAKAIKQPRSEEHTSELQSLMRISYAVFCLKKKKKKNTVKPVRILTQSRIMTKNKSNLDYRQQLQQ